MPFFAERPMNCIEKNKVIKKRYFILKVNSGCVHCPFSPTFTGRYLFNSRITEINIVKSEILSGEEFVQYSQPSINMEAFYQVTMLHGLL